MCHGIKNIASNKKCSNPNDFFGSSGIRVVFLFYQELVIL